MTVGELRHMLHSLPDDLQVLSPDMQPLFLVSSTLEYADKHVSHSETVAIITDTAHPYQKHLPHGFRVCEVCNLPIEDCERQDAKREDYES